MRVCVCMCDWGWGQESEQMADIAAAPPPLLFLSSPSLLSLPHGSSAGYGVGAINRQGGGLHPSTTHLHPTVCVHVCVCHRGPLHQAASLGRLTRCAHAPPHVFTAPLVMPGTGGSKAVNQKSCFLNADTNAHICNAHKL